MTKKERQLRLRRQREKLQRRFNSKLSNLIPGEHLKPDQALSLQELLADLHTYKCVRCGKPMGTVRRARCDACLEQCSISNAHVPQASPRPMRWTVYDRLTRNDSLPAHYLVLPTDLSQLP